MAESLRPHGRIPPPKDGMLGARATFPRSVEDFKDDDRVIFDKNTQKHVLEDDDGSEWEWNDGVGEWVPLLDESLIEQQQRAYKVDGVDEEANTAAENNKKRKAELKAAGDNKRAKNEPNERPNTAIYVSGIPLDAEFDEINTVFKKYGLIEEDIHSGLPKIKMYADDDGNFKGDARIIYFKPQSVPLVIQMLDNSDFRTGSDGNMHVELADWTANKNAPQQKEVSLESIKKKRSKNDRAMAIRKTQEMNARLADWDDDDISVVNPPPNPTKYNKMVVLKHMFTLEELEEDPASLLDIKEDIRDEAANYGEVTNTVLYDLEPSGVVTVRFKEPESAARCAEAFNGRGFSGRKVIAYVPQSKEQFSKSNKAGPDGLQDIDDNDFGEEDKADGTYTSALEGRKTLEAEQTEEKGKDADGGLQTSAPNGDEEKRKAP
ncbi:hypothetical protein AAFC00_005430 [Neodothiora populina]|uniref:RRM domain-containing protein n=1 Tax=Neodothiora populina TaxID=2781224 RepID=A0ABR3PKW4_9PEZI